MISFKPFFQEEKIEKENWRFELKYRISFMQYQKLKIALKSYMKEDYYTKNASLKRYLVRSLYYDTYDYAIYHEKMSGDSERIKYRLRTYSEVLNDNTLIKVEMKVRQANAMEKFGEIINMGEYLSFISKKHWFEHNSPVLHEFERYIHLKTLQPQVLIQYLREGYTDRAQEGIRVTFDHKVKSVHATSLFPSSKLFFREHHPQGIVFEIKCRDYQPFWLRNIIRDYGLKLVANSKFAQGIQTARQDLYRPDGVVVVR